MVYNRVGTVQVGLIKNPLILPESGEASNGEISLARLLRKCYQRLLTRWGVLIRGTDLIVLQLITLKSGTPKPQNLDPQNLNHFALDPEGRFSHLYLAVS
jgi:hypothetical protein